MTSLCVPRSARHRSAYQRGYEARLRGVSKYASPYADVIERAQQQGKRPGWITSLHASWVEGWEAANSLVVD